MQSLKDITVTLEKMQKDITAFDDIKTEFEVFKVLLEEVKQSLNTINNPSDEYRIQLEQMLNSVKANIQSLNKDIETEKLKTKQFINYSVNMVQGITAPLIEFTESIKRTISELKKDILNLNDPSIEYKSKLEKSLVEIQTKIDSLNSPIDVYKKETLAELNKIREEIYSLKNPSTDSKKVTASDLLDEIGRNDVLLTKFAKTVLDVSHPENFIFPPSKFDASPMVISITLEWNQAPNADIYDVYYNEEGTIGFNIKTTPKTRYLLTGLKPGTLYNIYIIAKTIDGSKVSNPTKTIQIKTLNNK